MKWNFYNLVCYFKLSLTVLVQTWNMKILLNERVTCCFLFQLLFSAVLQWWRTTFYPFCSTFLYVAIKHSNPKQLKEDRIYLASTSRSWCINEGSQGRSSSGTLKQEQWRKSVCWPLMLSLLCIHLESRYLGNVAAYSGLGLPILVNNECSPPQTCLWASQLWSFLQWDSHLRWRLPVSSWRSKLTRTPFCEDNENSLLLAMCFTECIVHTLSVCHSKMAAMR